MNYPQCLLNELAKYGQKPSGNIEWDKAMLDTIKIRRSDEALYGVMDIARYIQKADQDMRNAQKAYPDLTDPAVYELHARLFLYIANNIVLESQHREFIIDDNNRKVVQFLLYYFNNCRLAETVFPERGYKLHKNILLKGKLGVGKTMLMQCFSEYLRRINSPRFFHNLSVVQMVNYYTIHNNLDRFTYNEEENKGFRCSPVNVCLNDIGIQSKTFFGMDTKLLTNEFLHARNEIWTQFGKYAHVTTNLTIEQMQQEFSDGFGRLIDRFKTYNVIPLGGESRR
jgi:hypothetical protein